MNTKTRTISYRKIMIILITLFVVLLFAYALLMNAVVSTSKKLVQLEESVVSIQTKITQTERDIMTLRRSATKESALTQGFVESAEVAYIKTDTSKTAFLNE
jgi:hypothetical protein